MLTLAHPQFFLPVHGEFKQLKRHAETAEHLGYIPKQNIYIAENGQNIRLSADGMTVENTVTAGAVMVDGYGVGDVGNVVLRDRHHLSEDGIIIVTAAIDGSNGQVLSGPDLVSRGFVYVRESEELMEGAAPRWRWPWTAAWPTTCTTGPASKPACARHCRAISTAAPSAAP